MKKKKNKTIGVAGKQVDRNEKVEQIYYIFFLFPILFAFYDQCIKINFLRPSL